MSVRDLGGGKFQVRVYAGSHRREYRKIVHGKRAAYAHEADMRAKLARATYLDPHAGKTTFREYALRVIESRDLAPNTRAHYLRDCERLLFPLWGERELRGLRYTDAVTLTTHVGRLASGAGASNALVLARSVMRAAVLDGLIDRNPFTGLRLDAPKTRPKAVPTWREARIVAASSTPTTANLIAVLLGTGLRAGELCGLAVEDIDWLRRRVTVRRQLQWMSQAKAVGAGYARGGFWLTDVKTAAGVERVVPLPDFAVEALSVLAAQRPPTVELAVGAPDARATERVNLLLPLTQPAGLSARIASAGKRSSGPRFHAHALRHLYATTLEQGGVPLRTVQAVLGHEPHGVTMGTYVHVTEESLASARAVLEMAWNDGSPAQETRVRNQAGLPSEA